MPSHGAFEAVRKAEMSQMPPDRGLRRGNPFFCP